MPQGSVIFPLFVYYSCSCSSGKSLIFVYVCARSRSHVHVSHSHHSVIHSFWLHQHTKLGIAGIWSWMKQTVCWIWVLNRRSDVLYSKMQCRKLVRGRRLCFLQHFPKRYRQVQCTSIHCWYALLYACSAELH